MSETEAYLSFIALFAVTFLIGGWWEREIVKREKALMWRGTDAFHQAMKNAAPGDKTDVRI